jgi:hypothetical protein
VPHVRFTAMLLAPRQDRNGLTVPVQSSRKRVPIGLTSHTHLSHAGMNIDEGKSSLASSAQKSQRKSGRSNCDLGPRQLSKPARRRL